METDRDFAHGMRAIISGVLEPWPWFVLSPYLIHLSDYRKILTLIQITLGKSNFQDETLALAFVRECNSVLFWRGWMMRVQWCMQIFSIVILVNLIRGILHV